MMWNIILVKDENCTCVLINFVDSGYISGASVVINMPCRAKTPTKFERPMSQLSVVAMHIGMQILRGKVIEMK